MSRYLLTLLRLALPMWVGGAILFVATGVREVVHSGFDSMIRDQLVTIRFPIYYLFGGSLLVVGLVCALGMVATHRERVRWMILSVLLVSAMGLMAIDHATIYSPLEALVTPPGKPRTEAFRELHWKSEAINGLGLLFAIAGSVMAAWPVRDEALSSSAAGKRSFDAETQGRKDAERPKG